MESRAEPDPFTAALAAARSASEPLQVSVDPHKVLTVVGVTALYDDDIAAIWHEALTRHRNSQEYADLEAEVAAVDELHTADIAAYLASYTRTVQTITREIGITAGATVTVDTSWDPDKPANPLLDQIHQAAVRRTPLPTSGIPPKDYDPRATITDTDRAAGHTYRARAARDHQPR